MMALYGMRQREDESLDDYDGRIKEQIQSCKLLGVGCLVPSKGFQAIFYLLTINKDTQEAARNIQSIVYYPNQTAEGIEKRVY